MNRRKIQLGLCRALLDSLELYGARINEDEYAVADLGRGVSDIGGKQAVKRAS